MTSTENTKTESRLPSMIAWHVTDGRDKGFWTRIGAAWDHGDGEGLSVKLELFPLDGRVVLRPRKDSDKAE